MKKRNSQLNHWIPPLVGLFVFALSSETLHAEQPTSMPSALPQTIRYVLFLIVVLVGIFAISSFAFLRWSRRFRSQIFREPSPPTPAEDAWAMHQLPPDEEDENASGQSPDQDEHEE